MQNNDTIQITADAAPVAAATDRTDYLSRGDYFMATAFLAAQRSKDPVTQVGAVIVNEQRRIVGVGYNGFPRGCSDDTFPWHKPAGNPLQQKHMYVCHAEVNAVLNKNCADVDGCTIYTALFPCNECAKIIIQSGIRHVVYLSDKHSHKPETAAAKRMFEATGVQWTRHVPKRRRIVVNFGAAAVAAVTAVDMLGIDELCISDGAETPPLTPPPNGSPTPSSGSPPSSGKRTGYLSWSDYFMAVSRLSAQRSKQPNSQMGACIVNAAQRIVAIGYNGFPRGSCPTTKSAAVAAMQRDTKYLFECHAEVNAILNKNSADVQGCTMYVDQFPCNECAKMIIQSGIRHVVYLSDRDARSVSTVAAKCMFAAAGVQCELFVAGRSGGVVIDFDDIERRNLSQLPATPQ